MCRALSRVAGPSSISARTVRGIARSTSTWSPERSFTSTFGVRNLDDFLHDAEREHVRAARELKAAEKQLTAAREAVERFDAQHRR
jgi:hypothetical protein